MLFTKEGRMVPKSVLLCVGFAILPCAACEYATKTDLNTAIDKLSKKIDAVSDRPGEQPNNNPDPAPPKPAWEGRVAALERDYRRLERDIRGLEAAQADHGATLGVVEGELRAVQGELGNF